jgi:hypothetical protein
MIDLELAPRFQRMERAAPQLQVGFGALTQAHRFFQGAGALHSMSVSDVLDNGSIEATFQGVRIKFELLAVFGPDRSPRGRIVCMHCHCTYGRPAQDALGAFSFDSDGMTDLGPDRAGRFPNLHQDSAAIVLHFLDLAFHANQAI